MISIEAHATHLPGGKGNHNNRCIDANAKQMEIDKEEMPIWYLINNRNKAN